MSGQRNGTPGRTNPVEARPASRDRISLYVDRISAPEVVRARQLHARATAVSAPAVVTFGRMRAGLATRPRRTVVASLLATGAMLSGSAAALAATHHIVEGDTLSELAEQYDTTVAEMAALNHIANVDLIIAGDTLQLPDATPVVDSTAGHPGIHLVAEGDTLSEIAEEFGTSIEELVALNDIADPNVIVVGQKLLLPSAGSPDTVATSEDGSDGESTGGDAGDSTGSADEPGTSVEVTDMTDHPVTDDSGEQTDSGTVDDQQSGGDETQTADTTQSDEGETDASADTQVEDEQDTGTGTDADSGATGDETTGGDTADQQTTAPDDGTSVVTIDPGNSSTTLHLVTAGETLDSIAASYGITVEQLIAANAHAADGVTAGMILKIPEAQVSGIQLVGVPVDVTETPLASDAAAITVATGYWGAGISQDEVLAELPASDDPHQGFRGDVYGEPGGTDDYGVYAEPLASLIERYGFHAGVFYGEGDTTTLTAQIDAGIPVVVWITSGVQESEPVYEADYTLVPGKQAMVVFGYDDSGVFVVDVADGQYKHIAWDNFMHAWGYFDGMALAVAPL